MTERDGFIAVADINGNVTIFNEELQKLKWTQNFSVGKIVSISFHVEYDNFAKQGSENVLGKDHKHMSLSFFLMKKNLLYLSWCLSRQSFGLTNQRTLKFNEDQIKILRRRLCVVIMQYINFFSYLFTP